MPAFLALPGQQRYIQLTHFETAFKTMKSELGLRPSAISSAIGWKSTFWSHFFAYCLLVTLKTRLQPWRRG